VPTITAFVAAFDAKALNCTELLKPGVDPGGDDWGDRTSKTYESNFFLHHFVQFGKQHVRYKAILSSNVLPQQCCEICFHLSYSNEAVMRLDYLILLKSPPPSLTGWIRPWLKSYLAGGNRIVNCHRQTNRNRHN